MWLSYLAAALAAAPALAAPVVPAPLARPPKIASYEIRARLEPQERTLTGSEVLTWTNVQQAATSELQLHLYYNAWRNSRSSWMKAAALRGAPFPIRNWGENDWAENVVSSVKLLGTSGAPTGGALPTAFIQPDDRNPDDRTVLRVSLPAPAQPGETVRVAIDFRLKIPRPFARTGVVGDYYLMAQWFPKVGVYEAGGWNTHQFIQTEFFADFGDYDVTLDVPARFVVGATGDRHPAVQNADGTTRHRFTAQGVHDFAWTASPHFTIYNDRFENPGLPPVDIELLLLPDHASLRERYIQCTKDTLRLYGEWFHPYAWHRITVVDPPWGADTGGMEYPMFVTGESRWPTLAVNRLAEANTIHEVGHMWWQGAVANNEFEDSWLDEAMNTYSHKRVLEELYRPSFVEKRYFHDFLPVAFLDLPRAQNTHGADPFDGPRSALTFESIATPSFRYDERTYYLLSYTKGGMALVTLERYLGWETMRRIMATFAQRYWFKHPKPEDFFAVANEVSGRDLGFFWEQAFRGTELYDYAVDRVASRPQGPPRGYVDTDGKDGGSVWQVGGAGGRSEAAQVLSTVDVRRFGGATFPVEVRVTFADGSVVNEEWDGRARWHRYTYLRPSAVRTVEIDPRYVLTLDVNHTNNSWTSRPEGAMGALKWTSKWAIWLQSLLDSAAFFS